MMILLTQATTTRDRRITSDSAKPGMALGAGNNRIRVGETTAFVAHQKQREGYNDNPQCTQNGNISLRYTAGGQHMTPPKWTRF